MSTTRKGNDLARLYRPSRADVFPDPCVLAMLDVTSNIVRYRKDVYDTLPPIEQRRVFHMKAEPDTVLVLLMFELPEPTNIFNTTKE